MKNINFPLVVIGAQWGDEGKGKAVDILAKQADYTVRFNGGNNAGHSVVVNGEKFKLSLLPSGILWKKQLMLSQHVVINPAVLLKEIDFFIKRGLYPKLTIDSRAHVVMPYHQELDAATEIWKGKKATGSLHLGIGYCYEDKNNRFGIRMEDLIDKKQLKEKLTEFFPIKKRQIELVYGQKTKSTVETIYKEFVIYGQRLKQYVGDVSTITAEKINTKKFLFEGAHGTFLDAVFGTYPYTTAVNTISGAVFAYVGFPPQAINTLGIVKAYTTRVGNGPFPTELFNQTGDKIRSVGGEFGTVSKRPRRCGWLDIPLIKTAHRLSGFNKLAITKLDVLSGIDKIKVCTHYKLEGKLLKTLPPQIKDFYRCQPVYKIFQGWKTDISECRKISQLPKAAKKYLSFIEKSIGVPIQYVFVGPGRDETIEI